MTEANAITVIVEILEEFAKDWGLDDIVVSHATTMKCDMGFESSDMMQLFAALQEKYNMRFAFQELVIRDGKFVTDLSVREVADFVAAVRRQAAAPVREQV